MDIPSLHEIDARLAALAERMYQHAEQSQALRLRLSGDAPLPKTANALDPAPPMAPQTKILERVQRLHDILGCAEECLAFTRNALFGSEPTGPAPGSIQNVDPRKFLQLQQNSDLSHTGAWRG